MHFAYEASEGKWKAINPKKATRQELAKQLLEADETIEKLKFARDQAIKEKEGATNLWMEETKRTSAVMADSFNAGKFKKQLQIIEHITAGRQVEAIQALLDPLTMVLNLEVRTTEDGHVERGKALLNDVRDKLIEHLNSFEVKKEEKAK